jgi:hypothetical protein
LFIGNRGIEWGKEGPFINTLRNIRCSWSSHTESWTTPLRVR